MRAGGQLVAEGTAGRRIDKLPRRNSGVRPKAVQDALDPLARGQFVVLAKEADAGIAPQLRRRSRSCSRAAPMPSDLASSPASTSRAATSPASAVEGQYKAVASASPVNRANLVRRFQLVYWREVDFARPVLLRLVKHVGLCAVTPNPAATGAGADGAPDVDTIDRP